MSTSAPWRGDRGAVYGSRRARTARLARETTGAPGELMPRGKAMDIRRSCPAGRPEKRNYCFGLFIVAVAAVACASVTGMPARAAPPVVFALESEPERLDPLTIRTPQTFRIAWQLYEGLIGLSEDGKLEPRLAASWEALEGFRKWRFTLQPDATFHASLLFGADSPSRRVTADDVVWSYTAFCSPQAFAAFVLVDSIEGCAEYNAGQADSVSGVRSIGPGQVEITLVEPEPFFLNRISTAWIAIFPREAALPQVRDQWGLDHVVGTGPYRLVSRSDTEYVLRPNPHYWEESRIPRIEELVFRVVRNPQVRLAELISGNVDISPVPPELFPALIGSDGRLQGRYEPGLVLKTFKTFNIHFIGIDLKAVPDVHLRRAMALGTDRAAMAALVLRGFGDLIAGPVPPLMPGAASTGGDYRPDLARSELARSDYGGDAIEMYVHDLAQSERIGQIFQQQMKAVGIDIRLVKQDYGAVIGRAIEGRAPLFQSYAEIVFSSPEPLLLNLFHSAKIPVPNFWKYTNPRVDDALGGLRGEPSAEGRAARSSEIVLEIMHDVPAIFLYSADHVLVHARRVDNVVVNPHEHYQLEHLRLTE